jgi:hypothetical protein
VSWPLVLPAALALVKFGVFKNNGVCPSVLDRQKIIIKFLLLK